MLSSLPHSGGPTAARRVASPRSKATLKTSRSLEFRLCANLFLPFRGEHSLTPMRRVLKQFEYRRQPTKSASTTFFDSCLRVTTNGPRSGSCSLQ